MRQTLRDIRRPLIASSALAVMLVAFVEMSARATGSSHSASKMLLTTLIVAGSLMYFWVLADAIQQPSSKWRHVPWTKSMWIFVLVVTSWGALILYLLYLKPRLDKDHAESSFSDLSLRSN